MSQTTQTTFVQHDPKNVNGSQGAFTIHKFKDAAGTWFQTTKPEIANAAYALLNQPVTVSWKPEQRGEYTNNVIISVQPAGAAVVGAWSGTASTSSGTPPATPQSAAPQVVSGDSAAPRIARSTGHTNGLHALELALKAAELGLVQIANPEQWKVTAHWIASTAVDLGGTIGSYIFKGSQPQPEEVAASAVSSGVVVGVAGAAQVVAPAPSVQAPVVVQAQSTPATDDDIPFMWIDRYGVDPVHALRAHH